MATSDVEHEEIYEERDHLMDLITDYIHESDKCSGCLTKHLLPAFVGYGLWLMDIHEKEELREFWLKLMDEALGQAISIEAQVLQAEIDKEKTVH